MFRTSVVKQLTEDGLIPPSRVSPSRSHSPISDLGKSRSPGRGRLSNQPSVDDLEDTACKLQPKVEGRILQMTTEVNMVKAESCIIYLSTISGSKEIKVGEGDGHLQVDHHRGGGDVQSRFPGGKCFLYFHLIGRWFMPTFLFHIFTLL